MTVLVFNDRKLQGGVNPLENPQTAEFPLPGPAYIGKTYQYLGETIEDVFENACFYKCVLDDNGRYIWQKVECQPGGEDQPITVTPFTKTTLTKGITNGKMPDLVWGQNYEAWIQDDGTVYVSIHVDFNSAYGIQSVYLATFDSFTIPSVWNKMPFAGLVNGNVIVYNIPINTSYNTLTIARPSGTYPKVESVDVFLMLCPSI